MVSIVSHGSPPEVRQPPRPPGAPPGGPRPGRIVPMREALIRYCTLFGSLALVSVAAVPILAV
ncbi:MAG: hypothetical protein VXX30_08365, partial [Planctomycetota bacterium]|nr:hypothetical protein [Planctomycetota bacterium]